MIRYFLKKGVSSREAFNQSLQLSKLGQKSSSNARLLIQCSQRGIDIKNDFHINAEVPYDRVPVNMSKERGAKKPRQMTDQDSAKALAPRDKDDYYVQEPKVKVNTLETLYSQETKDNRKRLNYLHKLTSNQIAIHNLPADFTEDQALGLVQKYGNIVDVSLQRDLMDNPSYVTITFESQKITERAHYDIDGTWIGLNKLKIRTSKDSQKEDFNRRFVVVSKLNPKVTEDQLLRIYSRFGSIQSIEMPLDHQLLDQKSELKNELAEQQVRDGQKRLNKYVGEEVNKLEKQSQYDIQNLASFVAGTPQNKKRIESSIKLIAQMGQEKDSIKVAALNLHEISELINSENTRPVNSTFEVTPQNQKQKWVQYQKNIQQYFAYMEQNLGDLPIKEQEQVGKMIDKLSLDNQDDHFLKNFEQRVLKWMQHHLRQRYLQLERRQKRLYRFSQSEDSRALLEVKDFNKELEDLDVSGDNVKLQAQDLKIEDVLTLNQQIQGIEEFKNRTEQDWFNLKFDQERIKDMEKINFNYDTLQKTHNLALINTKKIESESTDKFHSQVREKPNLTYDSEFLEELHSKIQDMKGRMDLPFNEIYHKEVTLIQDVIRAEEELEQAKRDIGSPLDLRQSNLGEVRQDLADLSVSDSDLETITRFDRTSRKSQSQLEDKFKKIVKESRRQNKGYAFIAYYLNEDAKRALFKGSHLEIDDKKPFVMMKGKLEHEDLDQHYIYSKMKIDSEIHDYEEKVEKAHAELKTFEETIDQHLPQFQNLRELEQRAISLLYPGGQYSKFKHIPAKEKEVFYQRLRDEMRKDPSLDFSALFETESLEQIRREKHKDAYQMYKSYQFLKSGRVDPTTNKSSDELADEATKQPYRELDYVLDTLISDSKYMTYLDKPQFEKHSGRKYGCSDRSVIEAYLGKDFSRQPEILFDHESEQTPIFKELRALEDIYPVHEVEAYKLYEQNKEIYDKEYQIKQSVHDLPDEQKFKLQLQETQEKVGDLKRSEKFFVDKFGNIRTIREQEEKLQRHAKWISKFEEKKMDELSKEEREKLELLFIDHDDVKEERDKFYERYQNMQNKYQHEFRDDSIQDGTQGETQEPVKEKPQKEKISGLTGKDYQPPRNDPSFHLTDIEFQNIKKKNVDFSLKRQYLEGQEIIDPVRNNMNPSDQYLHAYRRMEDSNAAHRFEKDAVAFDFENKTLSDKSQFLQDEDFKRLIQKRAERRSQEPQTGFLSAKEFARQYDTENIRDEETIKRLYEVKEGQRDLDAEEEYKKRVQEEYIKRVKEELKGNPFLPDFEEFLLKNEKGEDIFTNTTKPRKDYGLDGANSGFNKKTDFHEINDWTPPEARDFYPKLYKGKMTVYDTDVLLGYKLDEGLHEKFSRDNKGYHQVLHQDYQRILIEDFEIEKRRLLQQGQASTLEQAEAILKDKFEDLEASGKFSRKALRQNRQHLQENEHILKALNHQIKFQEKEYYFDAEAFGMTLDEHIQQIESFPGLKVKCRVDRDGFIIVNRKYEKDYKYKLDDYLSELQQLDTLGSMRAVEEYFQSILTPIESVELTDEWVESQLQMKYKQYTTRGMDQIIDLFRKKLRNEISDDEFRQEVSADNFESNGEYLTGPSGKHQLIQLVLDRIISDKETFQKDINEQLQDRYIYQKHYKKLDDSDLVRVRLDSELERKHKRVAMVESEQRLLEANESNFAIEDKHGDLVNDSDLAKEKLREIKEIIRKRQEERELLSQKNGGVIPEIHNYF